MPLLKPGRAALRNLGPGNKRKIGFVCQGGGGMQSWGLKFEGDQGWKLKEVLLGKGGNMCVCEFVQASMCDEGLVLYVCTSFNPFAALLNFQKSLYWFHFTI